MMMNQMQKFIKSVFWVVIVAFVGFIFFDWGMKESTGRMNISVIATVNGEQITMAEFEGALKRVLDKLYEKGEDVTEDIRRQKQNEVLNELIINKLRLQLAEKEGLTATDNEKIIYIKSYFKKDNYFDEEAYKQFVQNPNALIAALEQEAREALLSTKLEMLIASTIKITDRELREIYTSQFQPVKAAYILVSPDKFTRQVSVSNEEINQYYGKNTAQYMRPERFRANYVFFVFSPGAEEEKAALTKITDLKKQLEKGADFAALAQANSQDPGSKDRGGDLGSFLKGTMVPEFEKAAFALEPGHLSDIVKTEYGYHIIKVESKEKDQIHARHILIKPELSEAGRQKKIQQSESFFKKAYAGDFNSAAEECKVKVRTTGLASQAELPNDIKDPDTFIQTCSSLKAGETGRRDTTNGCYVVKLLEKEPSQPKLLAEVSGEIKNQLAEEKARPLAAEQAQQILKQIKSGADIMKLGGTVTDFFSIRDRKLHGIKDIMPFISAAQVLKNGDVCQEPVATRDGFFIIKTLERKPVDELKYIDEKEKIRDQILQFQFNRVYQKWMGDVIAKSKIKNYIEERRKQNLL